eukprot:gene18082-biopygen21915
MSRAIDSEEIPKLMQHNTQLEERCPQAGRQFPAHGDDFIRVLHTIQQTDAGTRAAPVRHQREIRRCRPRPVRVHSLEVYRAVRVQSAPVFVSPTRSNVATAGPDHAEATATVRFLHTSTLRFPTVNCSHHLWW